MRRNLLIAGLAAGGLHILALTVFYIYIQYAPGIERSQSIWYWMLWFDIDFPVSLLLLAMMSRGMFSWLAEMAGSVDAAFLLFHGIVGTLWWSALVCGVYYLGHRGWTFVREAFRARRI